MNVHLTIGGMCMLVPHVRPDGTKRMQLLFPRTGHHEHFARLLYLARYEDPGAAADEKREIPLEGRQFEISAPGHEPDFLLPSEIVNLFTENSLGCQVPQPFLADGLMHKVLRSRVQIGAGRHIQGVRPGAQWKLGSQGSHRFMATAFDWSIPGFPGTAFTLEIWNREKTRIEETRTLTPLPGTDTVDLFILHVTEPEVPDALPGPNNPPGTPPTKADHFVHYYQFLDPNTRKDVPEQPITPPPAPTLSFVANFGSEYTCIVATAPPQ